MKLLNLLFLLFFASISSVAQFVLRGNVRHAEDHTPLPFANVFLANTTQGTTTNDKGSFEIFQLQPGNHQLVVSYVGFQTVTKTIHTDSLKEAIMIDLKPNLNQLAEIKVKSRRDKQWKQQYTKFTQLFLGATENAKHCTILNPNAIWITEDSTHRWITVGAREPLLIENERLGYRIKYQMEAFLYDTKQGYLSYVGYPVYEDMKPNSSEQKAYWLANRDLAYYGSVMHLMRSIHAGTAEKEGFQFYRIVDPARSPLNALALKEVKTEVCQFPEYKSQLIIQNPVNSLKLTEQSFHTPEQTVLHFSGAVQVIYEKKEATTVSRQFLLNRRVSFLEMLGPAVSIQKNGHYFPALELLVSGQMVAEKMAGALPFDYQPSSK